MHEYRGVYESYVRIFSATKEEYNRKAEGNKSLYLVRTTAGTGLAVLPNISFSGNTAGFVQAASERKNSIGKLNRYTVWHNKRRTKNG